MRLRAMVEQQVPSGGSTLVILQEGKGLDVRSTVPSRVHVHEFKTEHERTDAAKNASNPSEAKQRFGDGSWRIFRIKADKPVGLDKVTVDAKNAKGTAEAALKVLVVEKKTVKVHVRPVHVHNGKEFVPLGKAADPKNLLDEMNAICFPRPTFGSSWAAWTRQRSRGFRRRPRPSRCKSCRRGFLTNRIQSC
jgi:hypothetical protein